MLNYILIVIVFLFLIGCTKPNLKVDKVDETFNLNFFREKMALKNVIYLKKN
jgi:hypothetical protein